MNAPVFGSFAPVVLVVGRIVSAISARYSTSSLVNAAPVVVFSVRQPVIHALPPIRATPPRRAVTRTTASRRVIISGVSRIAISLSVIEGSDQMLRRLSSLTAKSAARAVSAIYVSEGFTQAADVMHDT